MIANEVENRTLWLLSLVARSCLAMRRGTLRIHLLWSKVIDDKGEDNA